MMLTCNGIYLTRLYRFLRRHLRHYADHCLRHGRLSGAWATDHYRIMPTSCGDLQSALCLLLPNDISEIHITVLDLFVVSNRLSQKVFRIVRVLEHSQHVCQCADTEHFNALQLRRLHRRLFRQNTPVQPHLRRKLRNRNRPRDRPDRRVQPKFAHNNVSGQCRQIPLP